MDNSDQNKKLYEFLPIIGFLVVYFFLQMFDLMEATKIIMGVVVSFFTFIVMANMVKEEKEFNAAQIKQLNFLTGILSVMLVLIVFSGFLSWYRLVSNLVRSAVPLILLLIFFVFMFRAMRRLAEYKQVLEPKKQK